MKFGILYSVLLAGLLSACGGGGGSGTSANSSSLNSSATPIVLKQITVSPSTVIANTSANTQTAYLIKDKLKKYTQFALSAIIPNSIATYYPPANVSAYQQISYQLTNGTLSSLNPTFTSTNGSTVTCDLTNVGVLVNNIWLLDNTSTSAVANINAPTSLDSNCNVTYTTSDYYISSTGIVKLLNQSITQNIKDIIPANDPAFNTSSNTLLICNDGVIRELSIDSSGSVTMTDLTDSGAPTQTVVGSIAYNGTYLVGVSSTFSGYLVYKKGSTAFKIVRDFTNLNGNNNAVFINDLGQFITNQVYNMYVFDPVALTQVSWSPSTQASSMYGATGRYQTYLLSNTCMLWNYSNGNWINLYNYPQYTTSDPWAPNSIPETHNYERLTSQGYAYCVDADKKAFSRYDVTQGQGVGFNLDNYGYLASSYQLFNNIAYVTVTNTANSDVLYVQLNFDTGNLTYLGTITTGSRQVVQLVKMGGT